MFHVRGSGAGGGRYRLDRAAVAARVPLGPVLHPAVRRGARCCRSPAACPRASSGPCITGFLLLDTLLVGRPDMFATR